LLAYCAARFVLWTLSVGPRTFSLFLARLYVQLLDLALPRLRRTAEKNLSMALPALDAATRRRVIDGSFLSIARLLATVARFPQMNARNISEWIRYDGREHFDNAIADGKGVLFATAHLGNWELSAFAHALMAAPMHIVVRPLDNPRVDALIASLRARSGNTIIGKKEYARHILRALHRNEAVGVLIDQNTSLAEGEFVPFFGIPACVAIGFARLAHHSGAAVIPGFALWSEPEQRYVLKFYEPLRLTGNALEDTRRIHAHLESVIREHPDQWLWMHRRWKTRPPGEPAFYR
jgi:KDO2-lipid IV(A) lauroyltransferase